MLRHRVGAPLLQSLGPRPVPHRPQQPGEAVRPSTLASVAREASLGIAALLWLPQIAARMIPTVRAKCGSARSARWATASSTRASAPASGR